jgi:hypothetical protein
MERLGSLWTAFNEIGYLSVFRKSIEKSRFSLKSDKNNGYLILRRFHIYDNISLILLKIRKFSNKTHVLCSGTFPPKSCRLWDNVEKCGGAREAADGNMAERCKLD